MTLNTKLIIHLKTIYENFVPTKTDKSNASCFQQTGGRTDIASEFNGDQEYLYKVFLLQQSLDIFRMQ